MYNLRLLVLAQALCSCAAPLNTFVAGLIGARLAPSASWATLPVALLMVGLASSTVPAARWSARFGRRNAFVGGALIAALAAGSAAAAICHSSFWWFCGSTFALGFNQALVQQYRFAAAEGAEDGKAAQAISTVLTGTLLAAWLGPELAKRAPVIYGLESIAVAYLLLAAVTLLGATALYFLRGLNPITRSQSTTTVATMDLFRRPGFVLAIASSGLGYAVMVFVMTATPLSMHNVHGHSMGHTASVIQAHIMAMFAPSFISGRLISRFGAVRIMGAGFLAVVACLVVAAAGHALPHYYASLVLLGLGWNFLFVGATALLVTQYAPEERGKAEAINDLSVFTLAATGSLLSGTVMHNLGWHGLLAVAVIPTALILTALVWHHFQRVQGPVAKTASS